MVVALLAWVVGENRVKARTLLPRAPHLSARARSGYFQHGMRGLKRGSWFFCFFVRAIWKHVLLDLWESLGRQRRWERAADGREGSVASVSTVFKSEGLNSFPDGSFPLRFLCWL